MRVAFFSPMPPAKSGIADYSAALVEPLSRLVELEVFDSAPAAYDASRFDIALYQIGNNPYHEFVYEMALGHPGVIVLHEANLHYLLADITIRRGDWDAYMREVEYNAGPEALAHARRVRALEVGPDYEGIPMTRRVLESAAYLLAHMGEVPVLVVPCILDAGGAAGWAPSIYPAVWSFLLALRSRGLGSVITTTHLYRAAEAAELLGVPDGYVQTCLLPVAYTTGDDFSPAVRRPLAEVAFLDSWGQPLP